MVTSIERRTTSTETRLNEYDLENFKIDLIAPIAPERIQSLSEFYSDFFRRQKDLIESGNPKYFQATGELPLTTEFDALKEPHVWLPQKIVVPALVEGHLDTEILLHPTRVKALKLKESGSFEPSRGKEISMMDEFIAKGTAVHSSDFDFHSISEREAMAMDMDPETSARKILAGDLWAWTTNDMVTSPILTNSTPDIISAYGLAMVAALQTRAFVPMDGIWGNIENQLAMFTRARELLEQNPVILRHPDKDYLLERSRRLIGVTLKADPDESLEKMEILYEAGCRDYRIYDPRQRTFKIEETVKRARNRFSDVSLIAGNLMDIDDAVLMQEAGANGVSSVLFGGGICFTSGKAKVAVENMRVAYEFAQKDKLKIPFIVDSGTGDTYIILTATGASGFMKGQSILSGIEKPPFLQWQEIGNGQYGSNYSGEAAKRTKLLGGKVDRLGRPLFVEGDDTYVVYDPLISNVATSLYNLYQDLATGIIFARGKDLDSVRLNPKPPLVYSTPSTESVGNGHHSPTDRNSLK